MVRFAVSFPDIGPGLPDSMLRSTRLPTLQQSEKLLNHLYDAKCLAHLVGSRARCSWSVGLARVPVFARRPPPSSAPQKQHAYYLQNQRPQRPLQRPSAKGIDSLPCLRHRALHSIKAGRAIHSGWICELECSIRVCRRRAKHCPGGQVCRGLYLVSSVRLSCASENILLILLLTALCEFVGVDIHLYFRSDRKGNGFQLRIGLSPSHDDLVCACT